MRKLGVAILILVGALLVPLGLMVGPRGERNAAGTAIAYSLGEAERQLRAGGSVPAEVSGLGGITRLAGVVHDPERNDLILVGWVEGGEENAPLTLADLVVVLRALFTHGAHPLVSIDQTETTRRTGLQRIRFEGGIASTGLGATLLSCDIGLKSAALFGLKDLRSYFDLSAEAVKSQGGSLPSVSTKYWFFPRATLASRDGVFALTAVEVGVEARVVGPPANTQGGVESTRDEPAERFAQAAASNLAALGAAQPEVRRLRPLFELVAIVEGLRQFPSRPSLDYWLKTYAVPRVETPAEYPLLKREQTFAGASGVRLLTVDGGIDTDPLVMRLEDGDVTALREVVLRLRPRHAALTWRLPLGGWRRPGVPPGEARSSARSAPAVASLRAPGAHITRQVTAAGSFPGLSAPGLLPLAASPRVVAPSPLEPLTGRGGVYGNVEVRPDDFRSR